MSRKRTPSPNPRSHTYIDRNTSVTKFRKAADLNSKGDSPQAARICEEILEADPNHLDSIKLLSSIVYTTKNLTRFIELSDKGIRLSPNSPELHSNRGLGLIELKKYDDAIASLNKAIELRPKYAIAHYNLGIARYKLKQFEAAVASYDATIAIEPNHAEAYQNRGLALRGLRQFDAALASFEHAISLKPAYADPYNNCGLIHQERNQLDAAEASFDKAIAIKPDFATAQWNKSLALLLGGNFSEGWKLYEWRWKRENFTSPKRNFSQPLWLGLEPIDGKTVLLHSEQGFGDTIQFCRYARLVAQLGARVVMEVPGPLLTLLATLDGVAAFVEKGKALPHFDYHCPLLSLPLAFETTLATVPPGDRYLRADPDKLRSWAERLGPTTKPRVGLVWSGSAGHVNDLERSTSLSELLPHLPSSLEYISLQKELREADEITLRSSPDIKHHGEQIFDFSDTAALCELVDLVISVDTSVAHLAGALGKEVWILLPFSPDWRWLLGRKDSIWYPTAKLFRQGDDRNWQSVFRAVHEQLLERSPCIEAPVAISEQATGVLLSDSRTTHQKSGDQGHIACPVCRGRSHLFDVVDFNKCCQERNGVYLEPSGQPVYYAQCSECSFLFAPVLHTWNDRQFSDHIYNADYPRLDPDCMEARPLSNARLLASLFGQHRQQIRHLDYGGGNRVLSAQLGNDGWNSTAYDPASLNSVAEPGIPAKFNLISAFEVFEHVPDISGLMDRIVGLMEPECLIVFSTLLSDGQVERHKRLDWWYASPRNGHISIYSKDALARLGQRYGLQFGSFNEELHFFANKIPEWDRA